MDEFQVKYGEASVRLIERKRGKACNTNVTVLVTGCPSAPISIKYEEKDLNLAEPLWENRTPACSIKTA